MKKNIIPHRNILIITIIFFSFSYSQDIHSCVKKGELEEVKLIIKNNSKEIHSKDELGRTPLHWAIRKNHISIADYLIKNGAQIEIKDIHGRTPLCLASYFWTGANAKSIKFLLKNGANVNTIDLDLDSPLEAASYGNNHEIVNLLLDFGAALPSSQKEKTLLIDLAVRNGHKKLFEKLIKAGLYFGLKNSDGGSLLHSAAAGGSLETIKMLLEKGLDINKKDRYGFTPLHEATNNNKLDVVKFLIKNQSNPNLIPI